MPGLIIMYYVHIPLDYWEDQICGVQNTIFHQQSAALSEEFFPVSLSSVEVKVAPNMAQRPSGYVKIAIENAY